MPKKHSKQIRAITVGAMMAALSIVLERVISITPASNMMDIRISLSNVPIILSGLLSGSVTGAVCGAVSDIVGCFISGYAPFPILTLAPVVMGFLPAFLLKFVKKEGKQYSFLQIAFSVTAAHLLSSFFITTLGLSIMRGTYFLPMLITRLPSSTVNLVIDTSLVYFLSKSPYLKNI